MKDNVIIYEQPLNELIRACLRLEHLFNQMDHQINDTSASGTRNVVTTIINLLHLLDRPDIKAKLAKEISHHMSLLARLENTPAIDREKLQELMQQLDDLMRCFIDSNGKIGQSLREIELLNNLRVHLSSPGGGCSFDIPVFHYWQQQSVEKRQAAIKTWLHEFSNIRKSIEIILQLIREGTKIHPKTAEQGFYQELLDPQINLRLIRVGMPKDIAAYPEISVSRHFLSVRFLIPNIHERPAQYPQNFEFWLSHCSS